ncbi:hypothetical protein CTEN210_00953 [Chaetoceros tenuissimus]|uniref:Uncharacterized protein n=1 Tax=Chaetoceros tenuissimus TaxID=426638 RepID=A0AAD3GZM3_9STRA|nr:hypothetical protein CTEN210_00953 [Chaetoceros tenuissimus]
MSSSHQLVKRIFCKSFINRNITSLSSQYRKNNHTISLLQHTRNFSNSSDSNEKEWIPPSRPLSGDKGQSHLYVNQKTEEEAIQQILKSQMDDTDNELIDLDGMNEDKLKLKFEQLDSDEDMDEETIAKLIQDLELMESDNQGDDTLEEKLIDMNDETTDILQEEDVFQKHFESQDFLSDSSTLSSTSSSSEVPDWLATRRARLSKTSTATPVGMMTPQQAKQSQHSSLDIPIIKYTLLSKDEIMTSLVNNGAKDVVFIQPSKERQSYLGWKGLIIATASSYAHIRLLTDQIVYNLRKRGLAERGVVGAKYGAEGGEDSTMSKYARKKRNLGRGKKMDDGWMSVDCRNYIVHVQDSITRSSIDLEGLWSPNSSEAKRLLEVNPLDDDSVDDYVAENPIPDDYIESMKVTGDFWTGDSRGGYARNKKARQSSNRYTPASNQRKKAKNRGGSRF